MTLTDNTMRGVQIAKIPVDTRYLCGEVEAVCFFDAAYDLLMGNISSVRSPGDTDPMWQENETGTTWVLLKYPSK